jgi:hypothetical protein
MRISHIVIWLFKYEEIIYMLVTVKLIHTNDYSLRSTLSLKTLTIAPIFRVYKYRVSQNCSDIADFDVMQQKKFLTLKLSLQVYIFDFDHYF